MHALCKASAAPSLQTHKRFRTYFANARPVQRQPQTLLRTCVPPRKASQRPHLVHTHSVQCWPCSHVTRTPPNRVQGHTTTAYNCTCTPRARPALLAARKHTPLCNATRVPTLHTLNPARPRPYVTRPPPLPSRGRARTHMYARARAPGWGGGGDSPAAARAPHLPPRARAVLSGPKHHVTAGRRAPP